MFDRTDSCGRWCVRLILKASHGFLCMFPTPENTLWHVNWVEFPFYLETTAAAVRSEPLQSELSPLQRFLLSFLSMNIWFSDHDSNQVRLQRCFKQKIQTPLLCQCFSPVWQFFFFFTKQNKTKKLMSGLICVCVWSIKNTQWNCEYFMEITDTKLTPALRLFISYLMPFFQTIPQRIDFQWSKKHCHNEMFASSFPRNNMDAFRYLLFRKRRIWQSLK